MAFQDLSGQKFGRLTAIKVVGKNKKGESIWECLCDCGNITKSTCSNLKRGHTKSCGCYKKVCCVTHHETNTRLYKIWKGIKTRCYNKNFPKYSNYGGRGILVCEQWLEKYANFRDWAILNGYNDTLTIDRIDNNGNYEPSNCRWVNNKTQSNNRRDNCFITYLGETLTISQWGDRLGIDPKIIRARYKVYNLPLEKVFYKGDLRRGTKRK
jgi:hypothetical protein